jgi:hypothetical protein
MSPVFGDFFGLVHQIAAFAEEAFPFVADGSAIALVVKTGALLLARNGVTVCQLNKPSLSVKTCLVCRA